MRKKFKALFVIGTIILLVILGLIFWSNKDFIGLEKDIFSINYKVEKTIFSYDTERDFHGDGFSIQVEKIDKKSQDYFLNPSKDFFSIYPKRDYHRKPFVVNLWKRTPQADIDSSKTSFATRISSDLYYSEATQDQSMEISKYLDYSQQLLGSQGNYYAFSFMDHPTGLFGIDLYIISQNEGIIITINRQ